MDREEFAHSIQHLLPDDGVPLRFIDRRGQWHSDGQHIGGVEVVQTGNLPPGRSDPEKAARFRRVWSGNVPSIIHHTAQHEFSEEFPVGARKDVIRRRMEQLEAELVELESYGDDNYDDNTVLVFDMKFRNNDTVFTYAALKKEGLWFLTGVQNGSYKTWEQLVSFWKDKVVSIHKVSAFEEVFLRETSKNTGVLEGQVLDKDTNTDYEQSED